MEMELISQLITSVGFPTFIAMWLMWKDSRNQERIYAIISKNTEAIIALDGTIQRLYDKVCK